MQIGFWNTQPTSQPWAKPVLMPLRPTRAILFGPLYGQNITTPLISFLAKIVCYLQNCPVHFSFFFLSHWISLK